MANRGMGRVWTRMPWHATCATRRLYPILLRPEVAALAMSGRTVLVAVNALLLKRFRIDQRSARDLTDATSPQSE